MRACIIGAGIMGCTTALELAALGVDVIVLERAVPGAEASSAAAGILGAQVESHSAEELLRLSHARNDWEAFAGALRDRTGIDVGYKKSGVLHAAFTEEDVTELRSRIETQRAHGLRAEWVDHAGAIAVEPSLARTLGAAHFPDDAKVNPPILLRALVAALARESRITVTTGATVRKIVSTSNRCTGVETESETILADAVVLAAGSWSSLVPGIPASVPEVVPIRGQLVQLEERPPRLRMVVFGAGGYAVPRGDGRVICGSTMERVGFRREVTAEGMLSILKMVITVVPSLATAQVGPSWCNFRPHVATGAPLVGASPLPGLFLATGHHRNGILLAPHTAQAVARAVASSN